MTIPTAPAFPSSRNPPAIGWEPEHSFAVEQRQPRDFLTVDGRRKIRKAALDYGSIRSYNACSPEERDRWKGYLAQRFEIAKSEVTRDDWERANGWKIPSLVWTSLDAGCSENSDGPREVDDTTTEDETGETTTEKTEEGTTETTTTGGTEEFVVGDVVEGSSLSMVVRSVERTDSIGEFQEADAGNEFVVVRLAIKNTTADEFVGFSGLLQTRLKDSEDYTYQQTIAATGRNLSGGQIAPGEVSRGDIVYEVPTDASGLVMQFDFSALSIFSFDRAVVDLATEADSIANLAQDLKIDTHAVGTTMAFEGTEVTVNGIETTELGQFATADEGKEFVIVDISTTNDTGEEQHISTVLQMMLKDGEGFAYQEDLTGTSSLDRNYEQGSPLADGETRQGKLAYELEEGVSPLYWIFDFSLWTDADRTFWKLR